MPGSSLGLRVRFPFGLLPVYKRGNMDFFEWLAEELAKTNDEEIEIGLGEDVTVDEILET